MFKMLNLLVTYPESDPASRVTSGIVFTAFCCKIIQIVKKLLVADMLISFTSTTFIDNEFKKFY